MKSWFRYDGERTILATYDRRRPLEDFPLEQRIRAANVWKPREFFVTLIVTVIIAFFTLRAPVKIPVDGRIITLVTIGLSFVFARGGISILLSVIEWIYGPTFASLHPDALISDNYGDGFTAPVERRRSVKQTREEGRMPLP
jgi:hypothetical protein